MAFAGLLVVLAFSAAVACASRATTRKHAGRRLVFDDEFNGPAGALPGSKEWQVISGGGGYGNNELQYYTRRSSNLELDGHGQLVITARRERYGNSDYTSGGIQTKGKFATTFGEIEARIEIPQGQGLWPAFWTVGSDVGQVGWPASGEIDVMENIGQQPHISAGSIHGPQAGVANGYHITTNARSRTSLAGHFHIYAVTWSPNKLVFTLDGHPYVTYTPSSLSAGQQWVFNSSPQFLILNLAVGGTTAGRPNASTPFPARMLVDWVRVYSLR